MSVFSRGDGGGGRIGYSSFEVLKIREKKGKGKCKGKAKGEGGRHRESGARRLSS